MEIDLYREPPSVHCTLGRIAIGGAFCVWSLEDIERDGPKLAHETAIPAGRYEIVITKSVRFGVPLPLLLNVPNFDNIRIHAGNTDADTSGCILVGNQRGQDAIFHSRDALAILQARIAAALAGGEQVWITIHHSIPRGTFRA